MPCLLLLWLLCGISCSRICRWPSQEDLLRDCPAWVDRQHHPTPPRMSTVSYISFQIQTPNSVEQLPAKYIFVRLLRGTKHLTSNSKTHWIVWLSCTSGSAVIAYIVASAVPIFGNLVSLIGAVFITTLAFQAMACMWFYDNWNSEERGTLKWTLMASWAAFVIILGVFLTIAGTYGSIVEIIDSYKISGGSAAWSCADNSNST